MGPAARFRQELAEGFFVAPGCFDALSAKLAERAGFRAVHVSGYAVAATRFGLPDTGLVGMSDMLSQARVIADSVAVPVVCDIDAGFGPPTHVAHTIASFERAGVAAVHIEDQADPKRCPAIDGRQVVSKEAFVAKIQAACDARTDPDFTVIARSDADELGFEELIERANLYLASGADLVMPPLMKVDGVRIETLPPDGQMEWHCRLVASVDGPLLGIALPPGHTVEDMRAIGYAGLLLTLSGLRAAANALASVFREGDRSRHPCRLPREPLG